MRIRPGPNLLWCAVALAMLGLLLFVWKPAAWSIPAVLVAVVPLLISDVRHVRRVFRTLAVRRDLPVVVQRDLPFSALLTIENASPYSADAVVRDLVPQEAQPDRWFERVRLPAGKATQTRYALRMAVRGRHRFGDVWLRVQGRFGLLEGQRRYECPGEVKVLPDVVISDETLQQDALAEKRLLDQLTRTRLRGEGTEFRSLSEYRWGDDPHRIDWRASARLHRLIVRRYHVEQHRDVMIVVDCGRLMGTDVGCGTKLDRAVDAAIMLSRVALERGDRCGLGLFDDQVLGYLPPLAGPTALRAIRESIYDVQSSWRESNFGAMFGALQSRQAKRCLIIVLSDIVDADTSERFRTALASLMRRHIVIFAALKTPSLWETVTAPVDSMRDVARKAVVLRVLREREKALFSLSRSGLHVLDVEPKELSVPLINQYIELRDRNLL